MTHKERSSKPNARDKDEMKKHEEADAMRGGKNKEHNYHKTRVSEQTNKPRKKETKSEPTNKETNATPPDRANKHKNGATEIRKKKRTERKKQPTTPEQTKKTKQCITKQAKTNILTKRAYRQEAHERK
jgi:hypothetical protein